MNRVDHLLVILAEEASEVSKEVAKCLRFGPEEVYKPIGISNAQRVYAELQDLIAVAEMLQVHGILPAELRNEKMIYDKKVKVEQHLEYSVKCGRLENVNG